VNVYHFNERYDEDTCLIIKAQWIITTKQKGFT
jgi:hypothetical protein